MSNPFTVDGGPLNTIALRRGNPMTGVMDQFFEEQKKIALATETASQMAGYLRSSGDPGLAGLADSLEEQPVAALKSIGAMGGVPKLLDAVQARQELAAEQAAAAAQREALGDAFGGGGAGVGGYGGIPDEITTPEEYAQAQEALLRAFPDNPEKVGQILDKRVNKRSVSTVRSGEQYRHMESDKYGTRLLDPGELGLRPSDQNPIVRTVNLAELPVKTLQYIRQANAPYADSIKRLGPAIANLRSSIQAGSSAQAFLALKTAISAADNSMVSQNEIDAVMQRAGFGARWRSRFAAAKGEVDPGEAAWVLRFLEAQLDIIGRQGEANAAQILNATPHLTPQQRETLGTIPAIDVLQAEARAARSALEEQSVPAPASVDPATTQPGSTSPGGLFERDANGQYFLRK